MWHIHAAECRSVKKEQNMWYDKDEPQEHAKGKKLDANGHTSRDGHMNVHSKSAHRNRREICHCPGLQVGVESDSNWYKTSFRGDGNALKLNCGDSYTTLWIYSRLLSCTLKTGGKCSVMRGCRHSLGA